MTSARPGASFLKDIDRIFNEGTVAGQFDEQLLKQFVRTGDELAFGALVGRYGPMVLAVSRRLLRDKNYAEDAFQATFLVLVRRARSIHQGEMLGAWLHRVAVRVALEANRASVRRKAEERKAAERLTMSFQLDTDRDDWPSQLHEELERLPPRYRLPIVLCHLQDLTQAQAAEQLRLSFGTLRRRLARGRELLQTRLSRRGVGLSSGLTGSLLPTRGGHGADGLGRCRDQGGNCRRGQSKRRGRGGLDDGGRPRGRSTQGHVPHQTETGRVHSGRRGHGGLHSASC